MMKVETKLPEEVEKHMKFVGCVYQDDIELFWNPTFYLREGENLFRVDFKDFPQDKYLLGYLLYCYKRDIATLTKLISEI